MLKTVYCCVCNEKFETKFLVHPVICENCKKKEPFIGNDTELIIHMLCEKNRICVNRIIKLKDQLAESQKLQLFYYDTIRDKEQIIRELLSTIKAAKLYPDHFASYENLKINTNRWKTKRLYTKQVNEIVNGVEIRHNCGCCSDSDIEVWPYYLGDGINDINIYSDPIPFIVGEGDTPDENWQQQFIDAKIPQNIIDMVEQWFKDNKDDEDD